MYKALLKKQLMEVNTWLIQDKKRGKNRSAWSMAGLLLLYAALFGTLGVVFYKVGETLCEPLQIMDVGWLYHSIMGLLAVVLGVFGSVFNTYTTLYKAKDNDLLLAMPIPPRKVLTVRLSGVWMWSLIYEAIVFVPAEIVYWQNLYGKAELGAAEILADICLLLLLSLFILTLSCILGWIIAKIDVKTKNRSFVIVLLSLAFIAVYYWGYAKAYQALQSVVANALGISEQIRGGVYPLYLMGRAGEGDGISLLLFAILIIAIFAVVYGVLARTFFRMATTSQVSAKKQYREKEAKVRGKQSALLRKECMRFASSPNYMLNCGLATVLLPIAGIFLLVKSGQFQRAMEAEGVDLSGFFLLLVAAMLCTMASMNDITAPSVSLEGKTIWVLQSMPVSAWQVLKAKLKLHLVITEPPVIFCSLCCVLAVKPGIAGALLLMILPVQYVLLTAAYGLMISLKAANLTWTNEIVPIKQSFGVLASMLGGILFVWLLAVPYLLLTRIMVISSELYLVFCALLFAGLTALLLLWLKRRGANIFMNL